MTMASMIVLLWSGLPLANAHGRMTFPPARNIACHLRGECGVDTGLSAGGPFVVNAGGGYTHGICGDTAGDPQTFAQPGPIGPTFTSGQAVVFDIELAAHHIGFFDIELCPSPNITEDCFSSYRLRRSNCEGTEEQCRKWWKPALSSEMSSIATRNYPSEAPVLNNVGVYTFRLKFDLPAEVSCTRCVVRWHYYTTNSCSSPGAVSEEFWNCADVRIENNETGETVNTNHDSDGMDYLNLQPLDLKPYQTGSDFWSCPVEKNGRPEDYTCDLDHVVGGACLVIPVPTLPHTQGNPVPRVTPALIDDRSKCGTCKGCLWVKYNACYSNWPEVTCMRYTGYQWCGVPAVHPPTKQPTCGAECDACYNTRFTSP